MASAVNNAVARTASLLAVAGLPAPAGLGGDALHDPARLTRGFAIAMRLSAGLVALGGALAWWTVRNRLRDGRPACPRGSAAGRHCAVDAPPAPCGDQRPGRVSSLGGSNL